MSTCTTSGWQQRGLCSADPDKDRWVDLPPLRIRGKNNPAYTEHVARLRRVCQGCPVQVQCRADAAAHDVAGVWGGTDEFDRANERADLDLSLLIGQPGLSDADQRSLVRRLAHAGHSNAAICALLGKSPMTVSRLLDERPLPESGSRRRRSNKVTVTVGV